LRPEARAALNVHAENLRSNPMYVRLEGHADERGTREYNMALGERRANAVKEFLVLQGVNDAYLEVISYGEERPAALGSDDGSWSLNRRVEITKR
jgi:peptidoglycan-associated lipoprotein